MSIDQFNRLNGILSLVTETTLHGSERYQLVEKKELIYVAIWILSVTDFCSMAKGFFFFRLMVTHKNSSVERILCKALYSASYQSCLTLESCTLSWWGGLRALMTLEAISAGTVVPGRFNLAGQVPGERSDELQHLALQARGWAKGQ